MPRKSPPIRDTTRIPRGILALAIAVTPLALMPDVFLSHDVIPKFVLLCVAASLLLCMATKWGDWLTPLWAGRRGRLFLLLVAAQFLSLALSTLFSVQRPLAFAGTTWRRFGAAEQCAVLVIATAGACVALCRPAWIANLFRAIVVCGGLAAAYGILQYFGVDPFLDPKLYAIPYFGGITRPPATMGHALYFSAYLVPVFFIAATSAAREKDRAWRWVNTGLALAVGSAIVLSGTRSALLAVVAGSIPLGWRAFRARRFPGKAVVAGMLAFPGIALFIATPAGAPLRHRMAQWQEERGGPRLKMWLECPAIILRHPLLGTGPDTFGGEFRKVQSAELSRAFPDFYNETPHNVFLDVACAQGIPGLLILIGVFALPVLSQGGRVNPLRAGLEAALVGLLVSSLFASFTLVLAMFLWTLTGLVAADGAAPPPHPLPARWRFAAYPVAAALTVTALSLAAQDAEWANLARAVSANDFRAAGEFYVNAVVSSLGMPGYELWASREMALLGRASGNTPNGAAAWKKAADAATLAETRSEEGFSAAYQSSVLALASIDIGRAEAKARRAIELAPNWYKGHSLLSQILQITGRNDEAAVEAKLSAGLGGK